MAGREKENIIDKRMRKEGLASHTGGKFEGFLGIFSSWFPTCLLSLTHLPSYGAAGRAGGGVILVLIMVH